MTKKGSHRARSLESLEAKRMKLLKELESLDGAIEEERVSAAEIARLLEEKEARRREKGKKKKSEVIDIQQIREGTLIQQMICCGKEGCHCMKPDGELHGPYWYLFKKVKGRTRSKYIGPVNLKAK